MKRLALALLFPLSAFPSSLFSFGVKGGVPLTDAFDVATTGQFQYVNDTQRYTVGPEVDLNLPFGLGVEVDALYRKLQYDLNSSTVTCGLPCGTGPVVSRTTTSADAWDFPLLLKLRLGEGPIKPYVTGGPTFRDLSNLSQVENFFTGFSRSGTAASTTRPAELNNTFATGATIGGGIQLGLGVLRISPEIRFTRWGWNTFSDITGVFRSNPNQVDFLVGITF